MEDQKQYQTCVRPEAEWTDNECPKCLGYLVAKDKHGLYCCLSNCGWTDENEKTRPDWV